MGTKVIRVEADCVDILRKYSGEGSLTDGVREMERRINALPIVGSSSDLPNTAGSGWDGSTSSHWYPLLPADGMSESYWVRFRKELCTLGIQKVGE